MRAPQYRPETDVPGVLPPQPPLPDWRRQRRPFVVALLLMLVVPATAAGQKLSSDSLFEPSVLHDIQIRINRTDWETLKNRFMENTYYPCDLYWQGLTIRNVGVRSRGSGSRSGTKPHLGVDFGRYVSGQTFLGLKAIVLRNNIQDPAAGMRERITLQLFTRMGIPASRVAHTRLFINNKYAGVYTIVEPLNTVFLQRAFGESDGYLFSFDSPPEGYRFEDLGSDPALYVPAPFKPETHSSDSRPEAIADLVWTINNAADAVFRTAIEGVLDLDEFIKHIAIDTFIADNDSILGNWGINNTYWYHPASSSRFVVLPWDKSNAFINGPEVPIWYNTDINRLTARALAYSDVRARYLEYLLDVADASSRVEPSAVSATHRPVQTSPGAGWMEQEVEREYEQIRTAVHQDALSPYQPAEFEQEVERLRAFARLRVAYVTGEVERARLEN